MNNCYIREILTILSQISKVLSDESGQTINLSYTGNAISAEGGLSVEFQEIDIPSNLISNPVPPYPNDKDGYYKVTRIRLGTTILNDTVCGTPFTDNEIKSLITAPGKWGYYPLVK